MNFKNLGMAFENIDFGWEARALAPDLKHFTSKIKYI
jgi:hypothetical protein